MKLTWYSNAPWAPTGYGQQTAELVPRLKAAGHEVIVAANYGLNGAPMDWEGIPVYPAGIEPHSTALSPAHHDAWGGDWIITLYDVWPLERKAFPPDRTVSWTPVDHQPVPPEVAKWCKTVRTIAMSKWGQAEFARVEIDSAYIPHSINTNIFKPTPGDRGNLDVPDDAFLIVINAANKGTSYERQGVFQPGRKAWFEMFVAAAHFMAKHDDAYLYVHTDIKSPIGFRLERMAQVAAIPSDRLRWADPYEYASGRISQESLAGIYSAADVLLATSMGEGFGVPVIEAQACGTPVIVSNFSAQPELVGAGWTVKGQPWWDEASVSAFFVPYIGDSIKQLEAAYAARGDNGLRERAIAFAAAYDTDTVFDTYWKPYLAELEQALKAPPAEASRAERRRQEREARKAAKKRVAA